MRAFAEPTSRDKYDFLLRAYFGNARDPLGRCIDRAYLDFCRTMHGLSRSPAGKVAHEDAHRIVRLFLTDLTVPRSTDWSNEQFDERHESACNAVMDVYRGAEYRHCHIGQAQKWLNMSLKYVYVFGEERLPGYSPAFGVAHVPLDNIILKHLKPYGIKLPKVPWSRIAEYGVYLETQQSIRETFQGSAPLSVEFGIWS